MPSVFTDLGQKKPVRVLGGGSPCAAGQKKVLHAVEGTVSYYLSVVVENLVG